MTTTNITPGTLIWFSETSSCDYSGAVTYLPYDDVIISTDATDTLPYYSIEYMEEPKIENIPLPKIKKWKKPKIKCKRNYQYKPFFTKQNKKRKLNINKQWC
jgi:hypothetical protein